MSVSKSFDDILNGDGISPIITDNDDAYNEDTDDVTNASEGVTYEIRNEIYIQHPNSIQTRRKKPKRNKTI